MNTILIVGGGKLVYFLTRVLLAKGIRVTIINHEPEECKHLAYALKATVVHGNGSDPAVLEEAGAGIIDMIIAITPNDQDNLVICQIATIRFGVKRTLALVNDPDNEQVFKELGISAFSTTRIITGLIEQKAGFDEISNLIPVGEGKVTLAEIIIDETSPVAGKSLREIQMPPQSLIGYIVRGQEPIVPRGDTVLQAGDRIIVISMPEQYGHVLSLLTRPSRK
jgi:trk system potassium uptake protein TrkA